MVRVKRTPPHDPISTVPVSELEKNFIALETIPRNLPHDIRQWRHVRKSCMVKLKNLLDTSVDDRWKSVHTSMKKVIDELTNAINSYVKRYEELEQRESSIPEVQVPTPHVALVVQEDVENTNLVQQQQEEEEEAVENDENVELVQLQLNLKADQKELDDQRAALDARVAALDKLQAELEEKRVFLDKENEISLKTMERLTKREEALDRKRHEIDICNGTTGDSTELNQMRMKIQKDRIELDAKLREVNKLHKEAETDRTLARRDRAQVTADRSRLKKARQSYDNLCAIMKKTPRPLTDEEKQDMPKSKRTKYFKVIPVACSSNVSCSTLGGCTPTGYMPVPIKLEPFIDLNN